MKKGKFCSRTSIIDCLKTGLSWIVLLVLIAVGIVFWRLEYGLGEDMSPFVVIQGETK